MDLESRFATNPSDGWKFSSSEMSFFDKPPDGVTVCRLPLQIAKVKKRSQAGSPSDRW